MNVENDKNQIKKGTKYIKHMQRDFARIAIEIRIFTYNCQVYSRPKWLILIFKNNNIFYGN